MGQRRILVVEDDALIAEDISGSLRRLNFEVAGTASSGEEAIKKASQLKPDLVLMDIILKGALDGIKAAGHIIGQFNIPVVYLSSQSDRATLKRARETGPFGYLTKPFEEKEMAATIEMALFKHGMERRLKDSEQWLSIILRSIADAVIVAGADGKVNFMNPAALVITGLGVGEVIGKPCHEVMRLVDDETGGPLKDQSQSVISTGSPVQLASARLRTVSDDELMVEVSSAPLKDDRGSVTGVVHVLHDITEQRRAAKLVEKSEHFLNTIFDSIHEPFAIMDRELKVVRANDAYARLKGALIKNLVGKRCVGLSGEGGEGCDECTVNESFESGRTSMREKSIRLRDGSEGWVELYTHPIMDAGGKVSHVIEHARDITKRKLDEQERRRLFAELEHLSRTDALTGLLNRRALLDFLTHDIERSKRYGRQMSVILCDIDRFKEINDHYGHAGGDAALEHVAAMLRDALRQSDVLGRYGGDEFLIVLPETAIDGAREFAERLRVRVEEMEFKPAPRKKLKLTMSFGVSALGGESDSADYIITRADAALYASKNQGRNRVSVVQA